MNWFLFSMADVKKDFYFYNSDDDNDEQIKMDFQ